jgi:hypothetical protein
MESENIFTYIFWAGVIAASALFIVVNIKLRTRFLRKALNLQTKKESGQKVDISRQQNRH